MGLSDVGLSLGKSSIQLAADFAPVPWLGPAAGLLCDIIDICAKVPTNRNAAYQLRDRCHLLLLAMRDNGGEKLSERMQSAVNTVESILRNIMGRMKSWASKSFLQSVTKQSEIEEDIQSSHIEISDCLQKFNIISQLEIHSWLDVFQSNRSQDQADVMKYLGDIKNLQEIMNEALQEAEERNNQRYIQLAGIMQQFLGSPNGTHGPTRDGLQSNLYQLQRQSRELLPDLNLRRGEVRRTSQLPVSSTGALDIWEGEYLGEEKVAVKVLRAVNSDPQHIKRFTEAARIWSDLWHVDRGQCVLPFYGFCVNDLPSPYMVSAWPQNGTANDYVKKYPEVDHRELIRGIARGIRVLHSMDPPIVHGNIKGANVAINAQGQPLLADFGVSRVMENITSIPLVSSQGVADSYRWIAPETWGGNDDGLTFLSAKSDIYAFAMTVIELMTHREPFAEIRFTPKVLMISSTGGRPTRPTNSEVIERGLDDTLWELLCRSWAVEASARPTIQELLVEL